MPLAFDSTGERSCALTVAQLLYTGPLPLEVALRYATAVAATLRQMHDEGRLHGAIDTSHVAVHGSEVVLLPPARRKYSDSLADLVGFGGLLYAMLTGRPALDAMRLVPPTPQGLKGPLAVRAATMQLAERCRSAARETAPDFQKILTEVRLLHVTAKQLAPAHPAAGAARQGPVPALPGPVLLTPALTLEVFAGKAPPVMNPLGGRGAEFAALAPAFAEEPRAVSPEAPAPEAPALPPAAEAAASIAADSGDPAMPVDASSPGENAAATRRAEASVVRPIREGVRCPKCKGHHVRLSRPRTRFECFLAKVGLRPQRCHRCNYRYVPLLGRKAVTGSHDE